ncbi:hypothetical protein FRZ67_03365 [Panacibacter ginsenosidivorans]|uniref:Uncharacterized protein n=1 Tax=Panacibacter ginsenosidivorans TaxID=1813871 RepID=A0A5B8V6V7_9BACT|nr:hypothetical protein [Panacibacter ginsenosidivorans]QEC66386.1 hypothetical protein FRZ67_03365 [Panacibacter ginsenosidivorans]
MKKWRWVFITIIAFFIAFYSFAYFFVIPKAAIVSMPYKWRNIVVGLKRSEYVFYIGRPAEDSTTAKANSDKWIMRDENYIFQLQLHYNTDSIADHATITYVFSNYLFHKEGKLSEKKLE